MMFVKPKPNALEGVGSGFESQSTQFRFFNPDFPGKQPIKPLGGRSRQSEKKVKQVFVKDVKRDKATKTL